MRLDISLLGPLHITRDDGRISESVSGKALALLAYLAVESDRPHQRSAIAGLLWPEQAEERARHNLRQALTTLRHLIGSDVDWLRVSRETVAFDASAGHTVDVTTLLDHLDQRNRHNHANPTQCTPCMRRLETVVGLYRGDFLAGFSVSESDLFEDWLQSWRDRLRDLVIHALDDLVTSYLDQGQHDAAIGALRRQLVIEPSRESGHRALMSLLWQEGDRAGALAQYARCVTILDEEFSVEPGEETTALSEAIRAGPPGPGPRKRPPLRGGTTILVPVSPVQLIGREQESIEIVDLLARQDCRLVTITGPGGSGKTRLAIHIASGPARGLANVICFVSLAPVHDAEGVATAIATRLGLQLRGARPPILRLQEWLRKQSTLLVLDNAEQLVDCLDVIPTLLETVPDLTILVTSRERLNLSGEWVYDIGGLAFPATLNDDRFEGYDAVDLFMDRLRRVRPGANLRHKERPDVIRICQLVDGIPLALELAAAWATTLPLDEIAAGIRQSLDFLSATGRDHQSRHHSMRAVFDSSWEMLTPQEQEIWRRLSVFENGFTLDAAQHVAGATPFSLSALINKSLVNRLPSGRYRIHGLLKQFGGEHLRENPAESADVLARHSRWYLGLLAGHDDLLTGRDQPTALQVIEQDIDNIRQAWGWGIEQGLVPELIAAAPAYWLFLVIHGRMREGRATFTTMLQAMNRQQLSGEDGSPGTCLAWGMASIYAGGFESGVGLYDSAITLLRQGIACLQPIIAGRIVGIAQNMLAAALSMKGQYAEARASLEMSLQQFGGMRDPWGTAFSLNDLGMMLHLHFHDDAGERSCEQSRDIFQRVGDRRGQALAASNLALIAIARGDLQRATRLHREALTLREESDDQWGLAVSRIHLGKVLALTGDTSGAEDELRRGLIIAWESSITPLALEALSELAALAIDTGDRDHAQITLTAIARHPSVQDPVRERAVALLHTLGIDDVIASPAPVEDRWAIRTVNEITRALVDVGKELG